MSQNDVEQFLRALRRFTPSDVALALKSPPKPDSPSTVAAICTWLSSMNQGLPAPPREYFLDPLEVLARSKHPSAPLALRLIAEKADNARIRLEAVRRLGRVPANADVRKLLHSLIRSQQQACPGFGGETISADEFKAAAIQALAEIARPAPRDAEVVLSILKEKVESQSDSALFTAAADALGSLARPSELDYLAEVSTKLTRSPMALHILGICAKYPRQSILRKSDVLADALARSLHHLPKQPQLCDRLCNLARKLTCPRLLESLSNEDPDTMAQPQISPVVWFAVEAYEPVDEPLTHACLAFARSASNATSDGPCIRQLRRCAEAGHGDRITRRIVRMDSQGYKLILENGLLRSVLSSADQVVGAVCSALGEAPEVRDPIAYAAMRCVLALGADEVSQLPTTDWLAHERAERDHRANRSQQVAAMLRSDESRMRPLRRLAALMLDETAQRGALTVAERFTSRNDELAHLLLEVLLDAAGNLKPRAWEGITSTPGFRQFEDGLFPSCEGWFKQHVTTFLVRRDRLNRYVLDLVRRRNIQFPEAARGAAQKVTASGDADHLLDQIARSQDNSAVRLLLELLSFTSEDGKLALNVRQGAIRRIADIYMSMSEPPEHWPQEVITKVHSRFNDALEVRLAAYDACRRIADPSSVVSLRKRHETESDSRAKTAIQSALNEIRDKLMSGRPDLRETAACIEWVQHAGELGDALFVEEMRRYLVPPHPDESVVLAALKCIARLCGQRALQIVNEFLRETSPEGEVLKAARRAMIGLQDRGDADLFEALSHFFPEDSDVLDPAVRYDSVLGGRAKRLAARLADSYRQLMAGHWDDFVTHLDGACDVLVRHLFESAWHPMKLDESRAKQLAARPYGNRLHVSEFRTAFPVIQAGFAQIHALRYEGTAAHAEDPDGTPKPGLTETEAKLAMEQFSQVFPRYVAELRRHPEHSDQTPLS